MTRIEERCTPFESELSALLDDQLDAARAGEVQRHVDACGACGARLAGLRVADAELRRIAAAPVGTAQIERVRSAIAMKLRDETRPATPMHRTPLRSRRWLAPVAIAAATAAAAALVFFVRPDAPGPERDVVAVAEPAPKSRADAEAAAREMAARIEGPIGASAELADDRAGDAALASALRDLPDDLATLSPAARAELVARAGPLWDLPPHERDALRARLADQVAPGERVALERNFARWQALSPDARAQLRATATE